jgi:hypothetical protein
VQMHHFSCHGLKIEGHWRMIVHGKQAATS